MVTDQCSLLADFSLLCFLLVSLSLLGVIPIQPIRVAHVAPPGQYIYMCCHKKVWCVSRTVSRKYQEMRHYTTRAGHGCKRVSPQLQNLYLLICERRTLRSTARAQQNDLQHSTHAHISDQSARNRLHEGGMNGQHPSGRPVLTNQNSAV